MVVLFPRGRGWMKNVKSILVILRTLKAPPADPWYHYFVPSVVVARPWSLLKAMVHCFFSCRLYSAIHPMISH